MENGLENVFIQNSVAVPAISYLIAAKELLSLLVFKFTVERFFEGGALSIECNRILRFFFITSEGFITFEVNYYICGFNIFRRKLDTNKPKLDFMFNI